MTGPRRPEERRPDPPPQSAPEWFRQARRASDRTVTMEPVAAAPPSQQLPAALETTDAQMKTATTSGVVRAGALMAAGTVVSRITGLLSKSALVAIIGTGLSSSAYTVANTLPNIVFELLIGGVLTSVAIPLLTRAQRSDADGGQGYTQRLMSIAVVGLFFATLAAVACAPLLARIYVSGRSAGNPDLPAQIALTTQLGRLLLPQIFFYGIAALFGAILNTKERFAANAWAPVLNNLVVIAVAGVLLVERASPDSLTRGLPTRELLILGIGTTLGIVVQALVMVPSLVRSGFRFRWRWGWDRRLSEAGSLIGWALVYVLISQVGVVVTTRIASSTLVGGPTIFSYASLLFQMPYGILGVAVLTAIMPRLSRHAADGRMADVKDDVSLANRLSAVTLVPVTAALVVLGSSVALLLFGYGQASRGDVRQIGVTIGALAIGLLPLAMTLVQMRVFYAMKDGRTPTVINGIMVAVRVPLLVSTTALPAHLVIPGLALATALSYVIGAIVGELWLRARFGPMGTSRTLKTIGRMLLASAVGGGAAWAVLYATVGTAPAVRWETVAAVVVGGGVGLVVTAAMAAVLGVSELAPVYRKVLRLVGRAAADEATPATSAIHGSPGGMGGSAGSAPQARPPGRSPEPPATHIPSYREQDPQRVMDADAVSPGTPAEPAGIPAGPPAAVAGSGDAAAGLLPDPSDEDITARPGGPANVDETLVLAAAPPVVLTPGASVGGRYRLVSLVTTDDAGNRFWRAKDTVLPRDMAVTVLPESSATSATVARTLRVGRLHHIGLPQTLDVGSEQGQSFVVGQWVDGATLTDLLAGGPLEPEVATSITAKVSEAVAEAHRNGIALGAINPSLVRVNFDGQVRLSHVIARGTATPDQDIRAVGALLYLMLTGAWPLPAAATSVPGASGTASLTAAPTRRGREVPAIELRPSVPTALSALAERALHPDDPAGIHAVSAIAALLRQPETTRTAQPVTEAPPVRPVLNPAERRLVRERRAKLGVASVMIAAFSALIIIVVASLAKQVMDKVAGPTITGVQRLSIAPDTPTTQPTAARTTPRSPTSTAASTVPKTSAPTTVAAPPAAVPQKITDATVYDPAGDGVKDNTDQVPLAFDGNPGTFWPTFVYKMQFPSSLKPGVGLTLVFAQPITPSSVTVTSDTPTTTIEVRSAAGPELPYAQTSALGRGVITSGQTGAPGSTTITLANAPKSKYLVVFVVGMGPEGQRFKSDINEISVSGF